MSQQPNATFPATAPASLNEVLGRGNNRSIISVGGTLSSKDNSQVSNIAFVDAGLSDIDTLIQGLENTRIVLLSEQADGVDQITTTLTQYNNLASVYIFSHGTNGSLQLGGSALNNSALSGDGSDSGYTHQLQQWQNSLSPSADLLFYGCDLAAGPEGLALINRISQLTGADVAASNDLTGIGGDWQLEVSIGDIESESALSASAQSSYGGTLSLLSNGDFEAAALGRWSPFTGTESLSTAQSFTGTQSLQLSAATSGVAQIFDAAVGTTYTLTGNAKSSSSGYAGIGLNFFDEDFNAVGSSGDQITGNSWNAYQAAGTAPEGSRYVQVWAYKDDASGNVFIDNLVLEPDAVTPPPEPPTTGEELLNNTGFEASLASWSKFNGSEAVSATESFAGGNSLQLSAANSGVGQIVDAVVGADYVLSAYGKSSSNDYAGFGINFFDASYNVLPDSFGTTITSTDWQPYQGAATAPSGTRYIQVWTYKAGAVGDVFLDEISLSINGTTEPPSDTTPPTATLNANDITATASDYTFSVTYADATAVDVSSVDNNDIRVTGPNGFDQNATFVSVDAPTDGTPRTGTYRISAPNSSWQAADNGTYTIRLRGNQVQDTLSNVATASNLGTFEVTIAANPVTDPGFIGLQTSAITAREDAGNARVTVLRTGGSDGEVSIDYNTVTSAGRPATAGEDFAARSGTLTFADGETEKSVLIPILNDTLAEGSENFGFAIDNIQGGATLLAPRTAQITIVDDESFTYRGNQYVVTSTAKTWAEAQAEAESLGGNLVTINAAAEENWLKQNFGETENFWLGFNDIATEGRFEWVSGEAVTYTNWAPGEPNNSGNQDSAQMNFGLANQWDDLSSGAQLRGIIEIGDYNGPANPVEGQGNGLKADYYNNANFTDLVVTRTDATVDFNWGLGSPASAIGNDTFSARWSGQLEAVYSETYTFQTNTDDGVRLWINDQLIIDQFVLQAPTIHTATISLEAGQKYDIRMEYYENAGGAVAQLFWSSASQALEIIPQSQLYSEPVSSSVLTAETVVTSLNSPTAIDWRPNSNQLFIAEKGGKVEIFEDGNLLPTPFIDISDQVNGVRDRGLLDLAIHPDFINNPYVYLLFTYDPPEVFNNTGEAGPDGINNRAARLIRVTADASNNYRTAVAGSEVVLLGKNSTWDNFNGFVNSTNDFNEPEAGRLPNGDYLEDFLNADSESHTIGSVEFGPDGALYVSNGDGASYNQVDRRAARVQDIDSLSGKVLRIDPITGEGLADNPFYNGNADANRSKVYQLGLRNPFRMAIDERNGQLYIGDVGWTLWEEINAAGAGANFGWPYYEGGNGVNTPTGQYDTLPEAQAFYNSGTNVTSSLLGLNHITDGINAIVMGDIYTGSVYDSQYQGDIFFNDLGQGIVRHASLDAAGNITDVNTFVNDAAFVVQMVEGPDELLYYVNLVQGTVGRWVFT